MSQQEIIDLLEKKGELSRIQIAKELKQDPIKVSHHLKKLIDIEEVSFTEYDREETAQRLIGIRSCRRTRFYYINE